MLRKSKKRLTRDRAIKLFCWECCGGNWLLAKTCETKKCVLWAYRPHSKDHLNHM